MKQGYEYVFEYQYDVLRRNSRLREIIPSQRGINRPPLGSTDSVLPSVFLDVGDLQFADSSGISNSLTF